MADQIQDSVQNGLVGAEGSADVVSNFRILIENSARMIGVEKPGVVHLFAALIDLPEAREMVTCLGGNSAELARLLVTAAWITPGDGGAEDVIRAGAPYAQNGEGPFRRRMTLEAIRLAEFHPDLQPILVASNLPLRNSVLQEEDTASLATQITSFSDPDDPGDPLDDFDFPGLMPEGKAIEEENPQEDKAKDTATAKKPASSGDGKVTTKSKMDEEAQAAVAGALRNLTDAARSGSLDPVIGRDEEIAHVISVLQRRRKSSILLHGDAGVGKTSIAEGVAQALCGPDAPANLAGRTVYEVSLPALVAGARFRGDFEARMVQLMDQVRSDRAILFMDEIHMLIGSGSAIGRGMDGANMLKPALARGDVSIIGATTTQEMRVLREDAALMRRFDSLAISEPDRDAALQILNRAGESYLDFHGLDMAPGAYEEIVDISDKYNPTRRFPDKVFDLMDMACVIALETRKAGSDGERPLLLPVHARQAAQRLGLRLPMIPTPENRSRMLKVGDRVLAQFPDRAEAVKRISSVLRSAEILPGKGSPAVMLLGPETAEAAEFSEAFAKALDRPFRKIDGAMLADGLGAALLVGSRMMGDKYPTSGIFGEIAESACRPILHFDHVERMQPEVQAILAKLIAQGHVQGGDGKLIDLSGAALFLSVTPEEKGSFGFSRGQGEEEGVSRLLIPELQRVLLHRVSISVPSETELMAAAKVELSALTETLSEAGYEIDLCPEICAWLAAKGKKGGLAEIRRLVTTEIRDRVTAAVLAEADMSRWSIEVEDLIGG